MKLASLLRVIKVIKITKVDFYRRPRLSSSKADQNTGGTVLEFPMRTVKPGLHMVGRIAEHACDDASKRILKLLTYRLKIFLVKYQNL